LYASGLAALATLRMSVLEQLKHAVIRLSVLGSCSKTEVAVSYVQTVPKIPFVFSYVEYCDMHFVYGFCDGNTQAAVEEYQRRFPDRRTCIYSYSPDNA
jgi:hypothetical protein